MPTTPTYLFIYPETLNTTKILHSILKVFRLINVVLAKVSVRLLSKGQQFEWVLGDVQLQNYAS